MEARLNPSLAPRFWELDQVDAFQPLCKDLLEQESGIATAEVYGIPGQGQQGIDILGKDINGQIIVVGQCKCYEKFKPAEVTKAAEEFHKYYEYWKEKGVNRFILMVACDLSDRKIQDEISNQHTIFNQISIYFEAWSGSILRNKLMPHQAIAQRHIHSQEVLRNICGPTVQGLIFTPNDSIEKTLQKLREAMREPDLYYMDIEDLFIEEAKNIINVVHNPPRLDVSSFNSTSCNQYLQPFISASEKLVKLSSELIKLDRQERFIEVLVRSLTILAQDPLKSVSYIPGIPEIRLYPLVLMIYTIYIIGTERKSTQLLQQITKIAFRSQRSELQNQNLPGILWCMYNDPNTESFFRTVQLSHIEPSHVVPITKIIKDILFNWLEKYLTFFKESYYCGEFILGLTLLESNKDFIFPALYLYLPESKNVLQNFMTNKRWLKELFPDIEDRLQHFDVVSTDFKHYYYKSNFQRTIGGFCGTAYNLYQNS
jgi:hypothetical protein